MNNSEIKNIFWDLDGTLATWESMLIVFHISREYLSLFPASCSFGKLFLGVARAYTRMLRNYGPLNNDAFFNRTLAVSTGLKSHEIRELTVRMIESQKMADIVNKFIVQIPEGLASVRKIAESGKYHQLIATNPIMPSRFNRMRLELAGYDTSMFDYITGSENFFGQKKKSDYYRRLLDLTGFVPSECLMVGNDESKDLIAGEVGIKTFLLKTEYTIRSQKVSAEPDFSGDYSELNKMLE
ncbi:MAG: HAD family hydrolase [Candidatus Riflebacteria bacterium]|nr:HAD family hydrolase [Candidatus Riflebacteria bacterium]